MGKASSVLDKFSWKCFQCLGREAVLFKNVCCTDVKWGKLHSITCHDQKYYTSLQQPHTATLIINVSGIFLLQTRLWNEKQVKLSNTSDKIMNICYHQRKAAVGFILFRNAKRNKLKKHKFFRSSWFVILQGVGERYNYFI